jgi:TRAP-type C4-dicarboxylate transport system permease small subunit
MEKLMHWANLLSKTIYKIVNVAIIVVCAMITVDIILQVFFRYVLNNSLQWSEETGVYLMIWMVFLGCSVLMRNEEHISITAVLKRLPKGLRIGLKLFYRVIGIIFLVLVTYYGFGVFASGTAANSPSLGISTKWVKLAIPVGATFMILHCLYLLLNDLQKLVKGEFD